MTAMTAVFLSFYGVCTDGMSVNLPPKIKSAVIAVTAVINRQLDLVLSIYKVNRWII